MEFRQPPVRFNEKGEIRKVGFEMEFANVDLNATAAVITGLFGGKQDTTDKYAQKIIGTEIGDFSLSLDLRLMSEKKYQQLFNKLGIHLDQIEVGNASLDHIVENALGTAIAKVIPYEISMPSLSLDNLQKAEELRIALYNAQAKGTKASILFAFAMHINPELPRKDVDSILQYMRAFFLLYPWLFKVCDVDFARRLTSFINPFPQEYIHFVLNAAYSPDLDTLIEDYHQYNSDRNRPLDLYPLFAWLNEEKINRIPNIGKVKPRPTFHYRLPNSLIDDPAWSIATEWNRWVEVERLANDAEAITYLSELYLRFMAQSGSEETWINKMEEWVKQQALANQK